MWQRNFSHMVLPVFLYTLAIVFLNSCETTKTEGTTTTTPVATTTTTEPPTLHEIIPRPTEIKPIQVSKEVFTQTFSEVELLIKALNATIRARDFISWTSHLSDSYRKQMSEPAYLDQLSKSATLQRFSVNLKSLEDYFNFVVVPSRANLRLDDLVFLTETEVEAVMVIGNRRVTLYRLIKIGDQWLIGLS